MTRFLLALVFVSLLGCIPIYIPTVEPEPYSDEQLAEVRIGQSTRQEIKDIFGTNYVERNNGSIWIFGEKRNVGYYVLIIAYYGGSDYIEDKQFIVFEFEDDLVKSADFIEDPNDCSSSGVCLNHAWHDDEKVLKDPVIVSTLGRDDKTAKSFASVVDACSIYAYNLYQYFAARRIELDDSLATLINGRTYLHLLLEPGIHSLSILDTFPADDALSDISTINHEAEKNPSFNFTCEPGDIFFLEIDDATEEHWSNPTIRKVDIDRARDAIANRSLILLQ